jgi:NAD-dependent SIR2 family protein deacetylase
LQNRSLITSYCRSTTPLADFIFNQNLVNDVAQRRVVVFVGSGVSAGAMTRSQSGIKDWIAFLSHAKSKLTNQDDKILVERLIADKDPLLACEVLKESMEPSEWADLLYQEFSQIGEPSALHKALVKLNQRITLTTNFDKLLENTWHQADERRTHYPQVINKISDDIFKIFKEERSFIIKIHGTIDDPEALIFAKADYAKRAF